MADEYLNELVEEQRQAIKDRLERAKDIWGSVNGDYGENPWAQSWVAASKELYHATLTDIERRRVEYMEKEGESQ